MAKAAISKVQMRCTEKCASHFDQHIPRDGRWRQSTARRENTAVIAPESGAYFAVTNETFLGGTAPGIFPRRGGLESSGSGLGCFTTGGGRGHLFECLVDGERGSLLTWWEILEGLQELADHGLSCHDHVGLGEVPVKVGIRRDVCPLEWIGPQVIELRTPQRSEGLQPNLERSFTALLHEHHLPIVVP